MSFNTFGRVFRFTTWGESHGPALGAVVDGCPPGLALTEADLQPWLDKRRPGTSRFTTQRREPDQVRILSGVLFVVVFMPLGGRCRLRTWGEEHGPRGGGGGEGCPPGVALTEADLEAWLDKRRPGTSRFTTQRREPDQVRVLSGVFEGRTTGTPISLMIENVDQRSKDYSEVAKAYRPGHADYAYDANYGFRDYRGGGRSSAREVAAGVAG